MSDNAGSKVTYFLVGLGVGALVGILFAPKSGDETREFLSKKADEGKDYAQRKARELRERADELIERGKDVASKQKESISAAVEGAREAYRREAGKGEGFSIGRQGLLRERSEWGVHAKMGRRCCCHRAGPASVGADRAVCTDAPHDEGNRRIGD